MTWVEMHNFWLIYSQYLLSVNTKVKIMNIRVGLGTELILGSFCLNQPFPIYKFDLNVLDGSFCGGSVRITHWMALLLDCND